MILYLIVLHLSLKNDFRWLSFILKVNLWKAGDFYTAIDTNCEIINPGRYPARSDQDQGYHGQGDRSREQLGFIGKYIRDGMERWIVAFAGFRNWKKDSKGFLN